EVPGPYRSKFSTLAKAIEDAERSYIFLKGALRGTGVLGGVLPPAILFGNSPAAIPQLEQALEADPDNGAILLRLSALYCDAGRASDAVALLKKAMEAHPDVPQHLHVALGKAYLRIPDADKAIAEFKQGFADTLCPKQHGGAAGR